MSQAGTVLVVDDDKQFAEMIALALRSKGFEVRTARNGFHGYASYFRSPSDWVVTDIQMRELDGVEMMRCIRALNLAVNTIYMSGAVDEYRAALAHEIREFGVRVMNKPFSPDSLVEHITKAAADKSLEVIIEGLQSTANVSPSAGKATAQ